MSTRSLKAFLLLALVALTPGAASAQDVTIKSRTQISFSGGLGTMMNVAARMGGGSLDSEQTQYIKGLRTRIDSDNTSSISDLERGRFLNLDHDQRTYTEFTFDSLAAMMDRMAGDVNRAAAEAPAAGGSSAEPSDIEYTVDVAVERPGDRERIAGYQAERVFVIVTVDARERSAPPTEPGARFVVLTDLWTSRDLPGQPSLDAMQAEAAESMKAAASGMTEALGSAMAGQPGQRAAFERAGEELAKIEGTPVRTTTYMVMGTTEHAIDREAVLAPPQESGGRSLGDVARSAMGGMFGRGRAQAEPAPAAEPTQFTVFKVVDEVIEVSTTAIPDTTFEAPANYRRVGG